MSSLGLDHPSCSCTASFSDTNKQATTKKKNTKPLNCANERFLAERNILFRIRILLLARDTKPSLLLFVQFYISGALPQIPAPLTLITSIIQPNDSSSLHGHAGDGIKDTEADACWETEVYEPITVITKDTSSMMPIYTHHKQCDQKYSKSSGAAHTDPVTGTISNHH